MTDIRCIGICTGGGDAPGLNAVIRAAVKCAFLKYNWKVIGIPDGFDGLFWARPIAAIPSNTAPSRTGRKSLAIFPMKSLPTPANWVLTRSSALEAKAHRRSRSNCSIAA